MNAHRRQRDVLDLLRENNPAPLEAGGLDFQALSDLDRILTGDLTSRLGPDGAPCGLSSSDAGSNAPLIQSAPPHWKATTAAENEGKEAKAAQATAVPLWRRPTPRTLAAAAAVAAAALIAVAGVSSPGRAPIAAADTPAALVIHAPAAITDGAATLDRLADLAAAQPAPTPAAFQYVESIDYHTVTSYYRRDGVDVAAVQVTPSRTRMWVSPTTGEARWETVSAGGTDAWSSDGIIDPTLVDPAGQNVNQATIGAGDSSFALPTDVAALKTLLEEAGSDASGGAARGYFSNLYNRFSKSLPCPAQQAAIWRLLASTGHMKTLGTTTDRAGRPAVALSYDTTGELAGQMRYQLLIDPVTGLVLGHEEIALKTSPMWPQKAPAVMGASTYLVSTGVSSNIMLPRGDRP